MKQDLSLTFHLHSEEVLILQRCSDREREKERVRERERKKEKVKDRQREKQEEIKGKEGRTL